MSWKPEAYNRTAVRRQMILDCLAAHPGAKIPDITAWLVARGETASAHNTLRTMADWSELRFEGQSRCRRYFALVATTRSAAESIAIREANLAALNAALQSDAVARSSTAHYVHKPGDHPIPNQGGQGAVRPRTHINCGGNHAIV